MNFRGFDGVSRRDNREVVGPLRGERELIALTPHEIDLLADALAERLAARLPDHDVLVDGAGAAKVLACSIPTVERLTRTGAIPSAKLGRLRRYSRSALLALAKGGDA
jgi:excisionase family DNA binding protein